MNLIYDHYFTEVDEPSADIDLLLQEVILENYNIHTLMSNSKMKVGYSM